MLSKNQLTRAVTQGRRIETARQGDTELGPLKLLPGLWQSLPGHGWNMIALPYATRPGRGFNFRLLVNQYDETLKFDIVDKAVPNRGIETRSGATIEGDQFVAALQYVQSVTQIAADDFPRSGLAGPPDLPIHREPGLWLHMANQTVKLPAGEPLDIGRLSTVPHGDSVLALGTHSQSAGAPAIPDVQGLPVGVVPDLSDPYLAPYKHFHTNKFRGVFDPTRPNDLLKAANRGLRIRRTTALTVDTTVESGGVVNTPFVVKQANASEMKSIFWIEELAQTDPAGKPRLRLQYSQVVLLDFFRRVDGLPGLIRWPHVSINTLEKVASPDEMDPMPKPLTKQHATSKRKTKRKPAVSKKTRKKATRKVK